MKHGVKTQITRYLVEQRTSIIYRYVVALNTMTTKVVYHHRSTQPLRFEQLQQPGMRSLGKMFIWKITEIDIQEVQLDSYNSYPEAVRMQTRSSSSLSLRYSLTRSPASWPGIVLDLRRARHINNHNQVRNQSAIVPSPIWIHKQCIAVGDKYRVANFTDKVQVMSKMDVCRWNVNMVSTEHIDISLYSLTSEKVNILGRDGVGSSFLLWE